MVSTCQAGYKNGTKIIKFLKTSPTVAERSCKFMYVFLSIYLIPGLVRNHYFFLKFWKMILMQNKRELEYILPSLEKLEFAQNDPKIRVFLFFRKTLLLFFLDLVYNENLYYLISQLKSHTYLVNFCFLSFGLKCS